MEHEADTITRDVIARIDKSFVTPIDREDIHLLVSQLDNVVDLIDGTARRAAMFHITEVNEPAKRICEVLIEATRSIESAVMNMRDSHHRRQGPGDQAARRRRATRSITRPWARCFAGRPIRSK